MGLIVFENRRIRDQEHLVTERYEFGLRSDAGLFRPAVATPRVG